MSVFDWVSLPKLRLTASIERWVAPLANIAPRHAFGNFSGRYLSLSRDGQMVEIRTRASSSSSSASSAAASNPPSFANRALAHGKMP